MIRYMTATAYSRNSFRPIRKDINVADLEAALPRLYCCSYFNRVSHPMIDPADYKCNDPPGWCVTIRPVHKAVGLRGLGDYIELCVTREYTNYTQVITFWTMMNGKLIVDATEFKQIYKNGYTEETFKQYIIASYPTANYNTLASTYYVQVMAGLKDCLEDWVDIVSIVRYEPLEVS